LTADDQDDNYDVYEWRNGKLSLLTDGSPDSEDALYRGNDRTGTNVYFVTQQSLSWQDHDVVADIYSARTGGGVFEPAPPAVCGVLGGGCHGGGAPAAAPVPARTVAPPAVGNAVPGVRARLMVKRPGGKARRRAARTGVIRLRVRVSRPGLVRAVARARMRTRTGRLVTRRVAVGRTRFREAGTRVLALRLNRVAVRRLQRGQRLGIRIRVKTAGTGARTVAVPLRRGARS
jgi:hypothetical protein